MPQRVLSFTDLSDRLLLALISNDKCQWCDRAVTRAEASFKLLTGRIVHAGDCEDKLDRQYFSVLTAIFGGKPFSLMDRDDDD